VCWSQLSAALEDSKNGLTQIAIDEFLSELSMKHKAMEDAEPFSGPDDERFKQVQAEDAHGLIAELRSEV
jgi:hypothetical protein